MSIDHYTFTLNAMRQVRLKLLKIIESSSLEKINKIPDGFSNNLIWNFMHIIVSQQLLCYALSGLKPKIDTAIIDAYRKGSRPTTKVDSETLKLYTDMTFTILEQFKDDIEKGLFKEYKPYETSFGLYLNNFEEAIHFNLAHETLHLGIMVSMRKLV